MARVTIGTGLDAITIEGALIAPEQVQRIAATAPTPQAAADYDCPRGTNLRDEISRYFRIGQAEWRRWSRIDAPTTTQTAAFVRALLGQAFGFDDLAGPVEHRDGTRRYRIALEGKAGRVPVVVAAPVPGGDGFAKPLPEFGDGAEGRARRAPTVLLQDWLNANPGFYWGLVFAGDRVRLMRDNASLTRPAWIEADLGAIFRDEMFADFTAMWLLIHASRFGVAGALATAAPLERWREEGQRQGTAARERLHGGVEEALRELGQGVIAANPTVCAAVTGGTLGLDALFEELLRTVYRLIFLGVAEDRDLLHPDATPARTRARYRDNYGFGYWRDRSVRRSARDGHHDAWEGMKIVLASLERGEPALGLPALGGLFEGNRTPVLSAAIIPNRRFLTAVHRLGWLDVGGARVRIDWRNMKTEELGSVYESLLELRPALSANGDFVLDSGTKGNARKTSGSYYTPDSLVEVLLDSALDPVLDRAEAQGGADAILNLKLIDPAIGSGHFMLGAARRMADRVARLRNEDAPDVQDALRDVVANCIHGVDRNPMAVELCKVALWIESVSHDKPLSFLDANIRCGDALLGVFDVAALTAGIPDDAYKPLTGDDRATASGLKKLNRAERDAGLLKMAFASDTLAKGFEALHAMPQTSVAEVRAVGRAYARLTGSPELRALKLACDAYVAAFLLPKPALASPQAKALVPTTRDVRGALAAGNSLGTGAAQGPLAAAIDLAIETSRAFHWPVEFPDVMLGRGGFDVVLGNPPWEVVQLGEEEYFESRVPEIARLKGATRKRAIAALEAEHPEIFDDYERDKRAFEAMNEFARASGRFDLTARGKVNTYGLFAEHFLNLTRGGGRAGVIVPTGIATDATTAPFFGHLVASERLAGLIDFENREKLFAAVDSRMKFCLLTLGSGVREADFAFFLTDPGQRDEVARRFTLSPAQIAAINPNTKTAPVFRARADAELTAQIYARVPVLIEDGKGAAGNPWGVSFRQGLFNMTSDSGLFRPAAQLAAEGWVREGSDWTRSSPGRGGGTQSVTEGVLHASNGAGGEPPPPSLRDGPPPRPGEEQRYVPLYEAKMIHQFDHRFGDYGSRGDDRGYRVMPDTPLARYQDPEFEPHPFYYVSELELDARLDRFRTSTWLMSFKDVTAPTNERTVIFSAIPRVGVGHTAPIMFSAQEPARRAALLANLNSVTLDCVARNKVAGLHLTYGYLKQFPILPPHAYTEADLHFIVPRVLELSYTSHAMAPFARDLGHDGAPFAWNETRRAQLRAELDAWYALAYGLTRDQLRYVLDPRDVMGADYPSETFRVLQKNEIARHGEYRTRRLVLAAHDAMVAAGARPRIEGWR